MVEAYVLGLGEEVGLDGGFEFGLGGSGLEVEGGVEGVEFEEVAMRQAARWAGAAVADAVEVVVSLMGAVGKDSDLWGGRGQGRRGGGDVPDEPVGPGAGGGVGIVDDEGEGSSLGGDSGPGELGGLIGVVAGVFFGDLAAVEEGR